MIGGGMVVQKAMWRQAVWVDKMVGAVKALRRRVGSKMEVRVEEAKTHRIHSLQSRTCNTTAQIRTELL